MRKGSRLTFMVSRLIGLELVKGVTGTKTGKNQSTVFRCTVDWRGGQSTNQVNSRLSQGQRTYWIDWEQNQSTDLGGPVD